MKPPTNAQLRYLRGLAAASGTTFTPPRSSAEASREIARLKARPRDSRPQKERELRQIQADLVTAPHDAVRFRAGETTGYGAGARWTHNHTSER